jgi:complement component 1 Q subcomponent-binding protein
VPSALYHKPVTHAFAHSLTLTFQISELDDPSANSDSLVDPEADPSVDPEEADLDNTPPFITCSLLITKSAQPGAMLVDLDAGENGFDVTNVAMYEKALGEAEGPEGDYQRRGKYMGPRELATSDSGPP